MIVKTDMRTLSDAAIADVIIKNDPHSPAIGDSDAFKRALVEANNRINGHGGMNGNDKSFVDTRYVGPPGENVEMVDYIKGQIKEYMPRFIGPVLPEAALAPGVNVVDLKTISDKDLLSKFREVRDTAGATATANGTAVLSEMQSRINLGTFGDSGVKQDAVNAIAGFINKNGNVPGTANLNVAQVTDAQQLKIVQSAAADGTEPVTGGEQMKLAQELPGALTAEHVVSQDIAQGNINMGANYEAQAIAAWEKSKADTPGANLAAQAKDAWEKSIAVAKATVDPIITGDSGAAVDRPGGVQGNTGAVIATPDSPTTLAVFKSNGTAGEIIPMPTQVTPSTVGDSGVAVDRPGGVQGNSGINFGVTPPIASYSGFPEPPSYAGFPVNSPSSEIVSLSTPINIISSEDRPGGNSMGGGYIAPASAATYGNMEGLSNASMAVETAAQTSDRIASLEKFANDDPDGFAATFVP
jgi:hypothetical protein